LPFDLSISEALRRAEERADALEAKLKINEKDREKVAKDAAAVEGLRQRLKSAERIL
jgi:Flp pilus assembly protein TadD